LITMTATWLERFVDSPLAALWRRGRDAVAGLANAADKEATAPTAPTELLIRFTRGQLGGWTVVVGDERPRGGFVDLEQAMAYALDACGAAPAMLWLNVDGLVVGLPQDSGWTRPSISEAPDRRRSVSAASGVGGQPIGGGGRQ